MFSGIIEEVGRITTVTDEAGGRRFSISAPGTIVDVKLGDSISCSGCCLTVVEFKRDIFSVEATHETLRCTKLGSLREGDSLNIERALRVSDRLGGHIVSGHVDAVGRVAAMQKDGFSRIVEFSIDAALLPFFVEKGSVTVDGVSLTVVAISAVNGGKFTFSVALIPHTMDVTTLGALTIGDLVNIEADIIGKYVARLVSNGYALPATALEMLGGARV